MIATIPPFAEGHHHVSVTAPAFVWYVTLAAECALVVAIPAARRFLARVPPATLVAMQVVRTVGVVFLVLEPRGVLPAHFALPAGLGDVAIGLAAPFVALALARRVRHARAAAIAWNVIGIVDLVAAVMLGALSTESSVRLFHSSPSTEAMTALPLSTIPTFGVPLFVLLHIASLMVLRDGKALAGHPTDRAGAGAPPARAASPQARAVPSFRGELVRARSSP